MNGCDRCAKTVTGLTAVYYASKDSALGYCSQALTDNCLLVNGDTKACLRCQFGFYLNRDGQCEQLTLPNCAQASSQPPFVFNANDQQDEARLYYLLAFGGYQGGCASCKPQYAATVFRLDGQAACVYGYYVFASNAFAANSPYVKNCAQYATTLSGSNLVCKVCLELYIPTLDGRACVQSIADCAVAQNSPNSALCQSCKAGFIRAVGACVKPNIEGCAEYEQSTFPQTPQCLKCAAGLYLKTGGLQCLAGGVANCGGYTDNSPALCRECLSGYALVQVSQALTYCFPVPPDSNCAKASLQNADRPGIGAFSCQKCASSATKAFGAVPFLRSAGFAAAPRTVCLSVVLVPNCLAYDDASPSMLVNSYKCLKCAEGFFYAEAERQCKERKNKDARCQAYADGADACAKCADGSFLAEDAKSCPPFPAGIRGCTVYSSASACQQCAEQFYLSNNSCLPSAKVDNCLLYAGNGKCRRCAPDFFLESETACVQAQAAQCFTYASKAACASCDPKSDLGLKTANGVTSCVSKGLLNCKSSTGEFPFKCLVCNSPFYPLDGDCAQATVIGFCTQYSGEKTCALCKAGYALNADGSKCHAVSDFSYSDANCNAYFIRSTPVCTVCLPGFYLSKGKCLQLATSLKGCLAQDPADQKTCLICQPGYQQASDQSCSFVGQAVQNEWTDIQAKQGAGGTPDSGSTTYSPKAAGRAVAHLLLPALLFVLPR